MEVEENKVFRMSQATRSNIVYSAYNEKDVSIVGLAFPNLIFFFASFVFIFGATFSKRQTRPTGRNFLLREVWVKTALSLRWE